MPFTVSGDRSVQNNNGIIYQDLQQTIFSGSFFDFADLYVDSQTPFPPMANGAIFDTPAVDDDMTWEEYMAWTDRVFWALSQILVKDAALILLPTNRKGSPYMKSTLTEMVATQHGWQFCREIIWDRGTDYFRPRYPYRKITVYRRGNMPMQAESSLRYKDILRSKMPFSENEKELGIVPQDVLVGLLTLFPFKTVIDPFAGSGSLAQACLGTDINCISCELDHDLAMKIADMMIDFRRRNDF